MDSFKHSCPFCSQRIEYTAGYCGKQMQCPSCGQTVTFPAVPPKAAGPSLKSKSLNRTKPAAAAAAGKVSAMFAGLRNFEHWQVVGQCVVPFLIIGALLGGALFVKNKFGSPAAEIAVPTVQADPGAWEKASDLNKADTAVKAAVQTLAAAHTACDAAELRVRQTKGLESWQRKNAEEQQAQAQARLGAARKEFDRAFNRYRDLGGTVDYRGQVKF